MKLNIGNAQTEKQKENNLEIHRIYVSQTFHGKKIGQLLLDEATKIAQKSGFEYICLGVWDEMGICEDKIKSSVPNLCFAENINTATITIISPINAIIKFFTYRFLSV